MISPKALELIINGEIGAIDQYNPRPIWSGGNSGITIGVGYDLGQHDRREFEDQWIAELSPWQLDMLGRCCLIRGGNARRFLFSLHKIEVPWDSACRVFEKVSLPQYEAMTKRAFPGCDRLPDDCYGALVSLVYNRGPATEGTGREEMAAIRLAIEAGDYPSVPIAIRSMSRLWAGSDIENGMRNRREAEAALFEEGLRAV